MSSPSLPKPSDDSRATWRIFLIPALVSLVGYLAFYQVDAWLRQRRGPWEITFAAEPDGTPILKLHQAGLGIDGVTLRFPGERVPDGAQLPATVRFHAPQMPVPIGRTAFDDLMYLPGTVVLHLFGHEVQLLPRTLFLNRREQPWQNSSVLDLTPGDRLPSLDPPPKRPGLGPPATPPAH